MTRLEFLRRNHPDGLSQTGLATRVGSSQTAISEVERGMRPSPQLLKKLARYFHIPAGEAASLHRDVPASVAEVPEQQARNERAERAEER
jgi:transcriptional regulator with XRE-family HTH domain